MLKNEQVKGRSRRASELNGQQRLFCACYVACRKGTQSAIEAGYKQPDKASSRLLARQGIQDYILQLEVPMLAKQEITAERVLEEYSKIAFKDAPIGSKACRDKLKAMDSLSKYLGLWKKNNADGTTDLAKALLESISRLSGKKEPVTLENKGEVYQIADNASNTQNNIQTIKDTKTPQE